MLPTNDGGAPVPPPPPGSFANGHPPQPPKKRWGLRAAAALAAFVVVGAVVDTGDESVPVDTQPAPIANLAPPKSDPAADPDESNVTRFASDRETPTVTEDEVLDTTVVATEPPVPTVAIPTSTQVPEPTATAVPEPTATTPPAPTSTPAPPPPTATLAPAPTATLAPAPTAAPPPTPLPAPPPTATAAPQPVVPACDPNYDPCVPLVAGDLNCGDIGFMVRIIGIDRHGFDGNDNDGLGCESYG